MTPIDLKNKIEKDSSLKTTMKINSTTSSMRGYVTIRPRKLNGEFVDFDFNYCRELKVEFPGTDEKPNFFTKESIHFYFGNEAYNYVKK